MVYVVEDVHERDNGTYMVIILNDVNDSKYTFVYNPKKDLKDFRKYVEKILLEKENKITERVSIKSMLQKELNKLTTTK